MGGGGAVILGAMKFPFFFLNLAKIQIFIPKSAYGGGKSAGLGIIRKNSFFFTASLSLSVNPGNSSSWWSKMVSIYNHSLRLHLQSS